MTIFVYESHMGGYFVTTDEYDYEDLYCEQCHDSDRFVDELSLSDNGIYYLYVEDEICYVLREKLRDSICELSVRDGTVTEVYHF